MKSHCDRSLLLLVSVAFLMIGSLIGQESAQQNHPVSVIQDWSHRHVVFTNGGSPEAIVASQRDPRFWHNWYSHTIHFSPQRSSGQDGSLSGSRSGTSPVMADEPFGLDRRHHRHKGRDRHSRVDWAISLGPNGGVPTGEGPAKFTFDVNAPISCQNDFVVFPIEATPGTGQANIIALNNLYTGTSSTSCPPLTAPTFLWSYAVGTGVLDLSPTLSLDGKKVAFVERASHPRFDVLTWVAGQGTDATHPAVPGTGGSSVTRLDYTNTTVPGCTANAANFDSNSSPYIDYTNDIAYVGADNGFLYRINGVFNSTPTLAYCIQVAANQKLTSPVFDSVSGKVFISDGATVYAFTPGATSFTLAGSITVANTGGIILSPIVDSTNKFVYIFSNQDVSAAHSIVSQMPTSLATHLDTQIGPSTGQFVLDGDFDNNYFNLGPASGSLYACGVRSSGGSVPALYTITFAANGNMNSTPAMSSDTNINILSQPAGACSPLLEFFDGTNDRLFVGVGVDTKTFGSNLVTMWNINNRITSNTTTPSATATNEWGGTSNFTIDNLSTQPQAASIYFGTLSRPPSGTTTPCGANNFCAIKLTQGALQ